MVELFGLRLQAQSKRQLGKCFSQHAFRNRRAGRLVSAGENISVRLEQEFFMRIKRMEGSIQQRGLFQLAKANVTHRHWYTEPVKREAYIPQVHQELP